MEEDKASEIGDFEDIDVNINKINVELERLKEEKFVNLIIEIIVSSTLKQYYEKSDTIPALQPDRPE